MNKKIKLGLIFCSISSFVILPKASAINYQNYLKLNILESFNVLNLDTFSSRIEEDNIKNSPKILTDLRNNIEKLEFEADLLYYDNKSLNYVVFYDESEKNNPKELFRVQIKKSGYGNIEDKKLLSKFRNNQKIVVQTLGYKYDKFGNILEKRESKVSDFYYTKKILNLVIKEEDKDVYNSNIELSGAIINNKMNIDFNSVVQYPLDKYYQYQNSEIVIGENRYLLKDNNFSIDYFVDKVTIYLGKNEKNWINVNLEDVTNSQLSKTYEVKKPTTIADFLNNNKLQSNNSSNYIFVGYFLNNDNINNLGSKKLTENTNIVAKYNTKIILKTDSTTKEVRGVTGEKLYSLADEGYFNKENYHIIGYNLIDNETGEKKEVESLKNQEIAKSITISPIYKENSVKVMVRQDDYNKRFGTIENELKNLDVEWKTKDSLDKMLENLKKKIYPNSGYEVVFRINKKVVEPNTYIKEDTVLEIYYRKKENEWITVRFIGDGIDKFLSDGQEVHVGDRLGNAINLPTSTSQYGKEFLGWQTSNSYMIERNGKIYSSSANNILSTMELGEVVAQKGNSLEFKARYRENYTVSFKNVLDGSIILSTKNQENINIKEGQTIGEALEDRKLIVSNRSHFKFTYFTVNSDVKLKTGLNSYNLIRKGEKIKFDDIYNIIPDKSLVIEPHFSFDNDIDLGSYFSIKGYYDIDKILNTGKKDNKDLIDILGPLYFLK